MISVYIDTCSERPQSLQHHSASGNMKTKKLSKQVRGKVVERYKSGLGYKKILETLNIPQSTIKSIIKKWKECGTTTNLPREGRPPKLTDQARRTIIREATKRPKITLKELQSSTVEIVVSVHGTILSCTLYRAGLYGRVFRKKPLLNKSSTSNERNVWLIYPSCPISKMLYSESTTYDYVRS
jgi:transposase